MVHNISSFSLLLVLIYMFTRIVRTCSYDMSRWWAPIPLHLLKVSIKYVHPSICNYFTCTLLIYCLTCANLHANSYIEYECVYHIVCFIHTYKCLGIQPQCLGVFQNIGHPTIGEVLATWCSILANLLLDLCWLCVKIIYIYIYVSPLNVHAVHLLLDWSSFICLLVYILRMCIRCVFIQMRVCGYSLNALESIERFISLLAYNW